MLLRLSLLVLLSVTTVTALDNGLAQTPQMGWNSWNKFGCEINEELIKKTANALVSTGLAAVGYKYVNLDDCWQISRDSNGNIVADPKAFPSGMKALGDYIHNLGLKFGVYSDAGYLTCQKRPGSLGFEKQDAMMYASWGVDYLKYDNCNNDHTSPKVRYPPMRDALNATGRPILYSMCEWGREEPWTWAGEVGNSWRTTDDISDNWNSMLSNLDANDQAWSYAGPSRWNDPDMLEVGNGGMTLNEYKAHFSLWALIKSPLIIGCDVNTISDEVLSMLSNPEVIAVNQDPLGVQGHKRSSKNGAEVWAGPLYDGSVAVVLFNRADVAQNITFTFNEVDLPVNRPASVRCLWCHKVLGIANGTFTRETEPHSVWMFRVTPQ